MENWYNITNKNIAIRKCSAAFFPPLILLKFSNWSQSICIIIVSCCRCDFLWCFPARWSTVTVFPLCGETSSFMSNHMISRHVFPTIYLTPDDLSVPGNHLSCRCEWPWQSLVFPLGGCSGSSMGFFCSQNAVGYQLNEQNLPYSQKSLILSWCPLAPL